VISSSVKPHLLMRKSVTTPLPGGVVDGVATWLQKSANFMWVFSYNAKEGSTEIAIAGRWHDNRTPLAISRFHILH